MTKKEKNRAYMREYMRKWYRKNKNRKSQKIETQTVTLTIPNTHVARLVGLALNKVLGE